MTDSLIEFLDELDSEMRKYRARLNRLFSLRLTLPRHCAKYFADLLTSTSRIYVHYLTLLELEPIIPIKSIPDEPPPKRRRVVSSDEESEMRAKLSERIGTLPCWLSFQPRNFFLEENQLRTKEDYASRLILHLPEMYGETTNVLRSVQNVIGEDGFSNTAIAKLLAQMQHMAHHASYCRHALEILSYEGTWRA